MATQQETIDKIQSRMKLVGDLPIFSASINRMRHISADPDSDAMKLAQEIMKDANLSVKVLRLANSPFYNRGRGRIGVISRAVVVLGFETLRNITLTLKLIESFQHEHPGIDMSTMLVRSYLSAGFVQELALKCGVKDVEETYTCALMHKLGEVAVAYFLPDEYSRIQHLLKTTGQPLADIQHDILGTSYNSIGQNLASIWEFPSSVVQTMGQYKPDSDGAPHDRVKFNRAAASLANQIVGTVYNIEQGDQQDINELFDELASATGVEMSAVENCLTESFKMSCTLAEEYGLNKSKLMPALNESEDTARDKLARRFSYYASAHHTEQAEEEEEEAVAEAVTEENGAMVATAAPDGEPAGGPAAPAATASDATAARPRRAAAGPAADSNSQLNQQLQLLQEITTLITDSASLNLIFTKVAEGLHYGVGFEHAALCLINRDHSAYAARIALGNKAEILKHHFQSSVDVSKDLFSKVLMEGNDLLVEDATDWQGLIRDEFIANTGATNFALAPLRLNSRPVGLFYADNATTGMPITGEQYRGFIQFISQARLALTISGGKR